LKSENIKRIRIGIGEPLEHDSVDYVLGKPLKDELPLINEAIESSMEAIKLAFKKGFDYAMNTFN